MSDNTTPSLDESVATDEIAGSHYQRVKAGWGIDGTYNDTSTTDPFPVLVGAGATSIAKAEDAAHASGEVGVFLLGVRHDTSVTLVGTDGDYSPIAIDASGRVKIRPPQFVRVSQTPTVSTSAYALKDAIGGLLTFADVARVAGGAVVIMGVTVIDLSQQMPDMDLVLFDRTFTASTDNAAFDPTDADLANVIGVVPIGGYADFNDNSVATRMGLNLATTLNGTSLFGQLVARQTPTLVGTSDITVIVHAEQR